MSAEAARIISIISNRKKTNKTTILLGTIQSLSPLTVKFDDINFNITSLLINPHLLSHTKTGDIYSPVMNLPDATIEIDSELKVGDRVAGAAAGGSWYVILCKVVKA